MLKPGSGVSAYLIARLQSYLRPTSLGACDFVSESDLTDSAFTFARAHLDAHDDCCVTCNPSTWLSQDGRYDYETQYEMVLEHQRQLAHRGA